MTRIWSSEILVYQGTIISKDHLLSSADVVIIGQNGRSMIYKRTYLVDNATGCWRLTSHALDNLRKKATVMFWPKWSIFHCTGLEGNMFGPGRSRVSFSCAV